MSTINPFKLDLAGEWRVRIDPDGAGEINGWQRQEFTDDAITLPGTADTHKITPLATKGNLQGFTPAYPYEGCLWYQRTIEIPSDWLDKHIALTLERCQWESAVWVDGQFQGSRNSLVAPHVYDLSPALPPGRRTLMIRVDNSNRKHGRDVARDDMTAHHDLTTDVQGGRKLNCGGHHLWSHNWIGILGEITLTARDRVRLRQVDVFPRVGPRPDGQRPDNPDGQRQALPLQGPHLPAPSPTDRPHPGGQRQALPLQGPQPPLPFPINGPHPPAPSPNTEFMASFGGALSSAGRGGEREFCKVGLVVQIANDTRQEPAVQIEVNCAPAGARPGEGLSNATWEIALSDEPEQVIERTLTLPGPVQLWDEFDPSLYELTVTLTGPGISDQRHVRFGMREVAAAGKQFAINGRPTFLRGTLENFIFPLTGHPPMDVASWRKVIATAKSYGLNLLRFHTCCPPAAAFEAADELGFYFQVELPGTSCPLTDEDAQVEEFLSAELARLLEAFGNHPSLLFVSMGNEQLIVEDKGLLARHGAVLEKKVRYGKRTDPRHMYTSTTHPINQIGSDDFHVSSWPVQGQDGEPLCGIQWGGDRVIDSTRFNTRAPETVSDYREGITGLTRPLMTHEVGQWAVYPDLREIDRYHGAERAFNFEIIRERLLEKGLLGYAGDFTRASGMLSLLLYKEEIEAALRTPGLGGFQLLGLTDYPGQGTSTIGILNALWESKGLTTPARFRAFCTWAVPLARIQKRVWTTDETFMAQIEFANYGPADIAGEATWSLISDAGALIAQRSVPECRAPQGALTRLGEISVPLENAPAPAKLILRVEFAGCANSWDIWVYPTDLREGDAGDVMVATRWDSAATDILARGGKVLLTPTQTDLREAVPGTFTPVFWNAQMKNRQASKTMGLLCDPAHPAFVEFPTEFHSNWQWWDIVMRSAAIPLDTLPHSIAPIVRVIDSFVQNRRLGMVFEARVGSGRLLVCAADITTDLYTRPGARQLRASLLSYMQSPQFLPDTALSQEDLRTIFVEY